MNRIYRLVWSKPRGMLIAVAETTRSRSKGGTPRQRRPRFKLTPIAAALAALGLSPTASYALPTGGQVAAGRATISRSGSTMNVNQASSKAILNWTSFGIGANEAVDFLQPSASSVALNRVLGGNASAIYGHLNANGQVFLVNLNGVYFAPGAQVDVGGLVASTLNITDADFLAGNYHFNGASTAGVVNAGTITAAQGGYVAFIGNTVSNDGTIQTPGGSTALGAGSSVDLTLAGDSLLSFQVSGAAAHALAANGGLIRADGGAVILTAQAKDALLDTVVNNSGVVRAQTVEDHNGTIKLLGGSEGTVQVAGTLDASAPNGGNGGTIETSGAHVKVADGATITTKAASGADGTWLIDPNDFTIAATGGDITGSALSTALGSGGVSIQTTSTTASCTGATCTAGTSGNGDIFVDDTVTWSKNTLTLNAYRDIVINTQMDGSGTAGLALAYGQGSTNGVIGGVTSSYSVDAPVNLASTGVFSTQLGSSGGLLNYTIITSLGSSNSVTTTDLQGIAGGLGGDYVLGANIDASATASWNLNGGIYYGFTPLGNSSTKFTGTFDGLGHTISALKINRFSTNDVGLFGDVGTSGTVRDVGLLGGSNFGAADVGALAGINDGTISDAYSSGSVAGFNTSIGGLVGLNNGSISDAYATGSVSADGGTGGNGAKVVNNVGGLVGNNTGTISDAYATGSVSASSSNSGSSNAARNRVGGLVGLNSSSGTISDAYATGSVSAIARTSNGSSNVISNRVGGLVGKNSNGTISNAYATGSVSASASSSGTSARNTNNVGGLVGGNSGTGTISDAYATGSVSASASGGSPNINDVGGLAGSNSGTGSNAYWDTATTGKGTNAGFGVNSGSVTGGGGVSTATLAGTLPTGFSSSVWGNGGNQTTPYLLADASFGTVSGQVILGSDASATPAYYGVILNVTQLQYINTMGLSGDYVLGTNIDASATASWNLSGGVYNGFAPLGNSSTKFTGIFDGLGHTISNLTIDRTSSSNVGLFGDVNGGTVRNVGLVGGSVSGGTWYVGELVGSNNGGTINNAYATGNVSGVVDVGGLVGYNHGTISNAYATGNVSSSVGSGAVNLNNVGGLVGSNSGPISNAYATGNVTGDGIVGGLVGQNYSSISNAHATGTVTGRYEVGGLAGANSGTISNAYATGTVSGSGTNFGGLVGNNSGTINNAYATGGVSGSYYVGGLIGSDNCSNCTISNAYATGSVSGTSKVGGLIGFNFGPISNAYATGSVGGTSSVGGLIGTNYGTVSDDYATGSVNGSNRVGGLVGYNPGGTISNAYATGNVTGSGNEVGGLVGYNYYGSISDDYATGSVKGSNQVGGLVGYNNGAIYGSISDSYATGSVSGSTRVGGLAGSNGGVITDAYWDTTTTGKGTNAGIGSNTGTVTGGGGLSTAQLAAALPGGFASSTWGNGGNQTTPYLLANASFGTVSGEVILGSDASATPTYYGVILNATQLQDINTTGLSSKYVLGTNIDASATASWNPNGSGGYYGFAPIGNSSTNAFTGTLDGLGHTISNLTIDRTSSSNVGLFGYVNGGTVRNVGLLGDSISGSIVIGGLVGVNSNGAISNAYATGNVSGTHISTNYVGGLVGVNTGTIDNAYATGNVTGSSNVGGLVGTNYGTITDAYATGNVTGANSVGGLAGANSGTITDAYATGSVSGTSNVGGLAGFNRGTSSDTYATGSVTGALYVGGLVGSNSGPISDAYATGSVTGTVAVGGLVGSNSSSISDAYATGSVTGTSAVGGLVGSNYGPVSNGYWDTTTTGKATNAGFGTNSATVTGGGLTTAQLAGPLPTGFLSSAWGNGGNQTTPYLLANASFSTVSGHVILDTDTTAAPSTPNYYDVILNVTQLQNINTTGLSGKYVLGTNIDASATASWNPNGSGGYDGFAPLGSGSNSFTGTFDGLGHAISALTINRPTSGNVGLFATVGYGGTVRDVGLLGASITGASFVGDLAGNVLGGTVDNVYATGSVTGNDYVGGLVGYDSPGSTISDAYATGSVSGGHFLGGLVGDNQGTTSNTYATGRVSGYGYLGGLIGDNAGTINNGYWDTATAGVTGVGVGSATGATALSAAQMLQQSSFTGFDFTTTPVWVIYAGHTAPLLNAFLTPLTVTSSNQTQTYTGSTFTLSNPTYSVTGAATSGHLDGLSDPYNGAANVGTYSPDLWSDQQGYRISYSGGTLSITPANATVTGNSASATYSGQAQSVSGFTVTGLVNNESASVLTGISASGATGTDVGSYANTVSGNVANGNYNLSFVNGSLTINPLPVLLTGSRLFDGTDVIAGSILTATNLIGTDRLIVTGSGTLASKAPGIEAISGFGSLALSNSNYTLTGASDSVDILLPNAEASPSWNVFQAGFDVPPSGPSWQINPVQSYLLVNGPNKPTSFRLQFLRGGVNAPGFGCNGQTRLGPFARPGQSWLLCGS